MTRNSSMATTGRVSGFLLLQMLLLGSGLVWAVVRYRAHRSERVLPVVRVEPLRVAPLYDDPAVVSDEQLTRVLTKLRPRLRGLRPNINHVDHALRFWGVEAVFEDPECLSGDEMRALLLDHRQYSQAWGADERPFLLSDEEGLRVRTQEGPASASHVDHTLATLAEVGTPLDYPVLTPNGERRLLAVLERSLRDFSLNQVEYEWSTLAYALYLSSGEPWFSTEGQRISFDVLAERIMRQRLAWGVCFGNHRLHALVTLLRVDDQTRILSDDGRAAIIDHLQDVTARLIETQAEEGFWDRDWPGVEVEGPQPMPTDEKLDRLSNRILATGHVLEWWSLAPAEVHPPRPVVVRAGNWLVGTIEDLSEAQVRQKYTFLTHAGRALSLWRKRWPADVELEPVTAAATTSE